MTSLFQSLLSILRRRNFPNRPLVALLALALCSSPAWAQSGAGSIQGTVSDPTGAVIPGAAIRVVNQATNVTVNTKSNRVGFYQAPGLFTGTYVVSISAQGMKTYVRTLDLLVAQSAVINAKLVPGAVAQQVHVVANAVQLVDTANGVIGSTLDNARINQLPMNGRDLITLVNEITPGLNGCDQSPSCANGLMPAATEYEVDGVSLASGEFGGANAGQEAMPDPDSVQEVSMETSGEGAEYATPATAVITTKSGTNKLHGSFFETARNNAFGIAKQRQDPSNYSAPEYIRNEFGASAGGPIVIPHLYHGKDKSFWFFAYERYSLAQIAYHETKVPTMAMRNGDWSGLVNGSGVLDQLYDPATTGPNAACPAPTGGTVNSQWCRTPFPTSVSGAPNQIPISRISPFAKIIYAIEPQPTTNVDPLVLDNFDNPGPSFDVIPNITFRLDQVFNQNNRAYLRFTNEDTTNLGLRTSTEPVTLAAKVNGANFPAKAEGAANSPTTLFATALGYTHIFSPTFFSETILSQQWMNLGNYAAGPAPHTDIEALMGVPNNFGEDGFPSVANNFDNMNGTQYQYDYSQILSNIDENMTRVVGRHQLQFGGRFHHERFGYLPNEALDKVDFDGEATSLENPATDKSNSYSGFADTGYTDADTFLGAAYLYAVNLEPAYKHFRDFEFDAYVQDNYHIARRLTLNLGLRYEAVPAPMLKDGAMTGFDLKNDAEVLGASTASLIAKGYTTNAIIANIEADGGKYETPQQAGQPSALMNNYDLNFLPRAGFAWQLPGNWGTILRAAYGRYLYPMPQYFFMDSVTGATPFQGNFTENFTAANQAPDGLPNYLRRSAQSSASSPAPGVPPIAGLNSANAIDSNS
ncbi:MAG: carboxypeptidase regulatory-like domain-containing protein, partial [Terracidiphilus sp.]